MITPPSSEPVESRSQYANSRILIVDDQAELHDDFVEMLAPGAGQRASDDLALVFEGSAEGESAGDDGVVLPPFELSHAFNGREACERIEGNWRKGTPFALAFIDVRMPGMDGIEAVQRIRETDRNVEIVVMTAYSDRSHGDIVRETELLHKMLYVRKPFTREEIQQIAICLVGKWNVARALAIRSQEIAASNRMLEAVLDATEDAMVVFDESGRFVLANRNFELVCGISHDDLNAMRAKELANKLNSRFREPNPTDVQAGFVAEGVGSLVKGVEKKGLGGLYYRSKAAVRDGGGSVIGRLEVYRDVSKDIEVQRMKGEVMRLRGELETTHSFGEMVGGSRKIRELYGLIQQAAKSDVTVLIRGETGTGKELVARSFHQNSARREGPFIAVNCAAMPEGLIESELFGHEKGAFTDAKQTKKGAFDRADGGTLFLDEIADMRLSAQAKLLRVLQEREFQRVGGSRVIKVDVRVLAATNRDLERAVQSGEFRKDLFYRLSVFPVTIPPLRYRREDIPLLASHFLKEQAGLADKSIDGVSTATMRVLLQYDWPGNIRELANVVERAVLLETEEVVQVGSLPRRLLEGVGAEPGGSRGRRGAARKPRSLRAIEREALEEALAVSGNNISAAARALAINRSTLYRKLRKHGLRS